MSFKCLQDLAQRYLIPGELANIQPPVCADFQYGRQVKRHNDDKPINGTYDIENPGDILHIDQDISSTPVHLLTPSGLPGKKRCSVITLMVDKISMIFFHDFKHSLIQRKPSILN